MKNIAVEINRHFSTNILSEYELKIKYNIEHLLGGELRKKFKSKLISEIHLKRGLPITLFLYP